MKLLIYAAGVGLGFAYQWMDPVAFWAGAGICALLMAREVM